MSIRNVAPVFDCVPLSPGTSTAPAVRLRGVRRHFSERTVLDGVDLIMDPGEFVALLGPSGSGKSTILRIIAGLDHEVTGSIEVPGASAVVFQEHRLLPWRRVWQNVGLGLPWRERKARSLAALAGVGLTERAEAWPATLSGGESQRAALARAIVRHPTLLLLDEPFASLDALTRLRMHGLTTALWREFSPAVLLVTHDVDEALVLADRALVLHDGRIAADIPITIDRPRGPVVPGYTVLRQQLLTLLGVGDDDATLYPNRPRAATNVLRRDLTPDPNAGTYQSARLQEGFPL